MRLLLTAFEPFDGTGLNASLEGCRLFLERWGSEFDLRFAVLPVEYGRDTDVVEAALGERPADVVLHTGQASGAREVRVERLAVNVRYPDHTPESRARPQQLIEADGPAGLFSPLPVDALAAAIRAEGVPTAVSNHAGIYLCNHILYRSLLRAERAGGPRAGFLHVPCLPEQRPDGEGMPAESIARAVRAAAACLEEEARLRYSAGP
jgi:pyroglutamyl-peptidase